MKRLEIGKEHYHSIFSAINNFTCRKETPKEALEFINQQKELLKPPDKGIDYTWIDKNRKTVVKYFFEMLKFMNIYEDAPQYNIAPINAIKNHFITIDKTVLYDMLNNLKMMVLVYVFISKETKRNTRRKKTQYHLILIV